MAYCHKFQCPEGLISFSITTTAYKVCATLTASFVSMPRRADFIFYRYVIDNMPDKPIGFQCPEGLISFSISQLILDDYKELVRVSMPRRADFIFYQGNIGIEQHGKNSVRLFQCPEGLISFSIILILEEAGIGPTRFNAPKG